MLALVMVAVLTAPQFEVQTLGGDSARGTLVDVSPEALLLQCESGQQSFAVKDLLGVASTQPTEPIKRAPVMVELIDGTRIPMEDVTSANGTVTLERSGENTLAVPIGQIRWIRMFDATEPGSKHDAAWAHLDSANAAGDVLVVRNKGNLVSTDGVVGDITPETVTFTLDENKIDVKRTKIEGIFFAKTAHDELPTAICAVGTTEGARWQAKELYVKDGQVRLTTPGGTTVELPLDSIANLDYSQGKLVYLSDLEPESFEYLPFFSLAKPLESLSSYYQLRRDAGLDKQPLQLDGKRYRKGLAMHARARAVYRLPDKFRTFTATVGIDDAVRALGGDVLLEISGDGKSLWKGSIRGSEPPQRLELDISGIKRLTILADYGAGEDIADHLDLCEAKVMK